MKILFVVPSYKPAYIYGGTIVVIYMLAEQLAMQGHDISVYTTNANGHVDLEVATGVEMLVEGVKVTYFKRLTGDHTHVAPALWKRLFSTVKSFDVVHIHSWWNPLNMMAALICTMRGVKPVFSPHGMLSTYIMNTNNRLPKQAVHQLIGKRLLRNSKLHVTSQAEWIEAKKIVPEWTGEVIPNLIQLSEKCYKRTKNEIFTIGFLSRIDPKKGLDFLIKALSKVDFNYKLLVAGEGEENYVNELQNLALENGNSESIEWVGWKNGEEKFEFLASLDLFALTSHNENFAVVVVEALSVGTPALITENVGIYQYVLDSDQGWACELKVEAIIQALNTLYLEKDKIKRINIESPARISDYYAQNDLAQRYVDLYQSEKEQLVSKLPIHS